MINFGTFALLLTLVSPAFAQAQDMFVPKVILTDKPSRRIFSISQAIRNGAKMPEDIRVHMSELTANRPRDLSKQIQFNKIESGFDLTYFYAPISSDLFLVVPPNEDAATYAELIRSIQFFDEAFDNKIPGDDVNGFSPKLPFLINKSSGEMRNLKQQEPATYALKPFESFGVFIVESRKNKATPTPEPKKEIQTFTIVAPKEKIQTITIADPSLKTAGPVMVKNMPGYRLFTVPLADGTIRQYTDRPIPGLIICEEILRKPKK